MRQFIREFNRGWDDCSPYRSIIAIFHQKAREFPFATALLFRGISMTYKELDDRSNRLAAWLQMQGICKGSVVVICMERCIEMVIAMIGTLKAGGGYLPIDPLYPAERIRFILEDSSPGLILCDRDNLGLFSKINSTTILSDIGASQAWECSTPTEVVLDEHDLAYIIYTSGSTGSPKGTVIEHIALANLSLCQIDAFGLSPGVRELQFASIGFDASCSEIFTALLSG